MNKRFFLKIWFLSVFYVWCFLKPLLNTFEETVIKSFRFKRTMASYLVLPIQHKCVWIFFLKMIHSEQNPIKYLNFRKLHNPQKGGATFHIQHNRIALLSEFVMERCINRATDQIQEHLWWETMALNFQTNLTAWIYNYTPFAPDLPVSHVRRPLTDQIQYQWKKNKKFTRMFTLLQESMSVGTSLLVVT